MRYLIMLALLMSGCTVFHEKPLPPSEATHVDLQVVWVDSYSDLPGYIQDSATLVTGAAIYYDVEDIEGDMKRHCTVWVIKPYNINDFKNLQSLGHEVLHCTDGKYHGRDGSAMAHEEFRERID